LGNHTSVNCGDCHRNLDFQNVSTECADCHADLHGGQFGARCQDCHSVLGWQQPQHAAQDHSSRFPLLGAHAAVSCETCHQGAATSVFAGLSIECATCHMAEFDSAGSVDHLAANFGIECQQCHSFDQWQNASFDHGQVTGFSLTGAHSEQDCSTCHVGGRFTGTPVDCFSCHAAAFRSTTNPDHQESGIPTDCALCHGTDGWVRAAFDHSQTQFQLTGAHGSVECAQCHVGGQYAGLATGCVSCHLTDFNGTTAPSHVNAGFPQNCTLCHTTSQWEGAVFDHNQTQFQLTGAHGSVECAQCHVGGQYAGLATGCVSCHLSEYNATSDPNHATAGFPTDCSACHSTAMWSGAVFDHSQTSFPLTGAHSSESCASCHAGGRYQGLSAECVDCHVTQYNATSNPNHLSAGFPQDCQLCHNTSQWQDATFNHGQTAFPLTGAHQQVNCADCHVNGVYGGTPTGCYSCHQIEYQNVTDPNHVAAGFPTSCETCHITSRWTGATFNHSFPIYSGAHRGRWNTCSECHTNASNYAVFSCLNCHEHRKTEMDDKHSEVRDYVYASPNCLACHPTGGGGD